MDDSLPYIIWIIWMASDSTRASQCPKYLLEVYKLVLKRLPEQIYINIY